MTIDAINNVNDAPKADVCSYFGVVYRNDVRMRCEKQEPTVRNESGCL